MEQYFATILEDVRHERSLFLLLSLTDPDIMRQGNFTDLENDILKNIALENLHRQRIIIEELAVALLEAELQ